MKDMLISKKWKNILRETFIKYVVPIITTLFFLVFSLYFRNIFFEPPYILFTLLVIFHSWWGGFKSGIFTTFLGVIAAIYFKEPLFNFPSFQTAVQIILFFIQAIIISFIMTRLFNIKRKLSIANESIADNENHLKNILDSIFTFIVVVDAEGNIIEANKIAKNISSPSNVRIIGKKIEETYPWNYNQEIKDRICEAIKTAARGLPTSYDDVLKKGEDHFIDVALNIVPMVNSKGETTEILISGTDITERKNYEKDLENVSQNYTKLVNSNILGMMIMNKKGEILEANDAFLDLLQYTKQEFKQKRLRWKQINTNSRYDFDKKIDLNDFDKRLQQNLQKEFTKKNGEKVPVLLTGVKINEDKGEFLCLVMDLSEQKKLIQKKDEFISIASHELKTPLTTLKGYTQLLSANIKKRFEDNSRYVNVMENQILKLTELINGLLDVSKIEAGKLLIEQTEFDLVELSQEIVQEVSPFGENREISFINKVEKGIVYADRFRIGQVISNFLTNAMKYSPEDTKINIHIEEDKDNIYVKVEDFGLGIPSNKRTRIFEKYYQVEESESYTTQHSMGLGLYISSEIIRKHSGTIGVNSEEGSGSTFYFSLPKYVKTDDSTINGRYVY